MDLQINYQGTIPRIQDLENRKTYFNSTLIGQNNGIEMKIDENLQEQTNYSLGREKDDRRKNLINIKENDDLSINMHQKAHNQINDKHLNIVETAHSDIFSNKMSTKEHFVNHHTFNDKNEEELASPTKHLSETPTESICKTTDHLQKSPLQTSLLNESLMFQDDFYREEEIGPDRFYNPSSTTHNNEDDDSNNDDDTDTATEDRECSSYEQEQAFRILGEIMSESSKNINWPFLNAVDANMEGCQDYYERIKRPMWLYKSKNTFYH